jgi:3-hydroxybutyryl-CoA dehydratase
MSCLCEKAKDRSWRCPARAAADVAAPIVFCWRGAGTAITADRMIEPHPSGGYILDELVVGMTAEKLVTVTEQRIVHFAEASDDFNPLHMDEAFASKTAYRGRIAHGLLSASFGSAVVGTILPGAGAIYLGQTLSFYRPVRIGEVALARVTVKTIDEASSRVVLRCEVYVGSELVMDGDATVRVPRRRRAPKTL